MTQPVTEASGDLFSLDAMAAKLGWEGAKSKSPKGQPPRARRLKLYLERREAELGCTLIIRTPGPNGAPRYRVSESQLRERCPELFGSRLTRLQAEFRRHLEAIDEKIRREVRTEVHEVIDPELAKLRETDEVLSRAVRKLQEQDEEILADLVALVSRVEAIAGP